MTKHEWMENASVQMVTDCCDSNDWSRLNAFFSQPLAAARALRSNDRYPFRLMAGLVLRSISARHVAIADLLLHHLMSSSSSHDVCSSDPLAVQDLLQRLGKLIFTLFSDQQIQLNARNWIKQIHTWKEIPVWRAFQDLYENANGGDPNVWGKFRASTRSSIAQRFFTTNKSELNETYLTYFSETAFGAQTLHVLARECKIVVSKSQLCKHLFANNKQLNDAVLSTILESWNHVEKPALKDACRLTSDDLQRLLYITDPDLRRRRLDIATTAGPKISIAAEELQRYHLTAFPDEHNPVPWIHATIVIGRPSDWMNHHILAYYLGHQAQLRLQAVNHARDQLDQQTWLPKELIRIVVDQYVFSSMDQLVLIDPISVPDQERLSFMRIWANRG